MSVYRQCFLWIGCLLLASCSASGVDPDPGGKYAPANLEGADGMVSYIAAGVKSVVTARRNDAYEKMYNHCGGKYEIVDEKQDQGNVFGTTRTYLYFKCLEAEAEDES